MSMTIREQLLAALRNNPGINTVMLSSMLGMTTKKISGPLSTLLADDLIAYEGKHGQRLYRLTSYGMRYAPDTIPVIPRGNSKLVLRTDSNVICQECRQSEAMKRVLMVCGRARA
ncbi:transcriptional regulator [Enterobacter hormaechei]|uniref:transcriptional regulator n=1 Tax=Enterobacter hormaechei TaxID=158836 RepID=UPI000DBF37A7|nr:transcriptional regulator [Enterobacter hormaechei]AWX01083.1 transcriptional regulator [Enterobacter hormaechei]MCL8147036.1 transcriptional regulator [Enterobacter hormaechei]MCM7929601.1 transcriptional regulator [Enterobacter hormaechei]MCM7949190.1 transcriptional regulator [Enterobacter hormaechei]RAM39840.1 transcriptional regulator [Enterobacter hormaechei]